MIATIKKEVPIPDNLISEIGSLAGYFSFYNNSVKEYDVNGIEIPHDIVMSLIVLSKTEFEYDGIEYYVIDIKRFNKNGKTYYHIIIKDKLYDICFSTIVFFSGIGIICYIDSDNPKKSMQHDYSIYFEKAYAHISSEILYISESEKEFKSK